PDPAARTKPTISPLQAPIEQLKGLPPALVITDENDVLRDEGEAYAQKLIQAGNTVTAVRYLGTIHDFAMLNAIQDAPAARSAIALASTSLQQVFAATGEVASAEKPESSKPAKKAKKGKEKGK